MTLRIGSLCTGYGGLDMAVMDVLDATVAWHCQYDPDDRHQYAARILEHHWPNVPNHGDITAIDWTQVEPIDVLTAGFPCQDLSYAGRGAGIKEGTRSGLWYAVARAVGALRPRLVVLENVRAIVARRPGLDVVLASLAELGFDAEWTCVRASDVGAPHLRERWFLLAWPADTAGPRLEGAGLRGRAAERGGAAADADDEREHGRRGPGGQPQRHLAGPDRDAADAQGERHGNARTQSERGISAAALTGSPANAAGIRAGEPADEALPDAEGRKARLVPGGRGERVAADADLGGLHARPHPSGRGPLGRDAADRGGAPGVSWGPYGPAVARWERILGRPAPRPVDDRGRLDPRFVEFMMGLSAGHVCDVPAPLGMTPAGLRNARWKALGNGVVPQQAAYVLRILLDRARGEVAA